MRTEKEMIDLILQVAHKDQRIRAVYLNGSRTNPNVKKDIFQDYDIIYLVTETKPFIEDKKWIDVFGERLVMQQPEEMDKIIGWKYNFEKCYGYLMQFADGNRLDLHLQTLDLVLKEIVEDKLTIILLDKDKVLPKIPKPSDEDYWVKKPTQLLFSRCCNEFWWILNNVAKGLWREEIPFVMDHLNFWIRTELINMLSWYVGTLTDFSCSVGKCGKYLDKYLPEDIWKRFLKTYPIAEVDSISEAVFVMCELFEELGKKLSDEFGFYYNEEEAKNSFMFLKKVKQLPKDAKEVL